ncbi:tail fiber assembly protein [Serratia ureilytica]|uniref:tail fiber assembly protein n=1 Tax=Serratia ureilytica TaxID=300181 RepID=UPI00371573E5
MVSFDENGFALDSGVVSAYVCSPDTRELIGQLQVNVQIHCGLPANSYIDEPPKGKEGCAIIRLPSGWGYAPDFRGKIAYDKETGSEVVIEELGELSDFYTFKKPATKFDEWDGNDWVTNDSLAKENAINTARENKEELSVNAESKIAMLSRAVKLGIATDKEKEKLNQWEAYSVYLSRVEVSNAPDIDWPSIPA